MIQNYLRAAWLCLCLSGLAVTGRAQQTMQVEVLVNQKFPQAYAQLPRWQAGLELSRPVVHMFHNGSTWDHSLPLEGLLQYRIGASSWYGQLYGGYFWGEKAYENGSQLEQRGMYLKPGVLAVIGSANQKHTLTMEVNGLISWGRLRGENQFYGPIFGGYDARASMPVSGYGAEFGIGAEPLQFKGYKIRGLARLGMVTDEQDGRVFYVPGAGDVSDTFIRITGGLSLYLMRAWGGNQSKRNLE